MANDLSRLTKAGVQKPEGAGTGGDAKSDERAADAADTARFEFERLAEAAEPRKYQVASIGHILYRLAADAPDLYRLLLADATIQSRLFEVERAFETPFFADAQSNAGATVLLEQVRNLVQDMAPEEPGTNTEEGDDERPSKDKIVSRQHLDAALQGLGEGLGSANQIYTLLDDSGTLTGARTQVADGDFRLLQLVSVLQAHLGISAAVARSAFPGEVREKVRQAEVGIAKLERSADSFQSMVNFVKIGGGQGDAMMSLLEIASAYPEAYAKYAELKQQSIAGLGEVTGVLGSDEAAVLFSRAGEKLLAVVVRKDGATVIPIKVPVSTLQATLSTLLASIRQPSDGANSLPSKFRADAAWTVYQQVFQPLEGRLAGVSTVYLVGGDLMGGLPFQTLLTARPPPQDKVDFFTYRRLSWLGDRFAFVSLPSMHSLKRLADKASQEAAARLWGVGEAAISGATLQAMKLSGIPDTGQLLAKASRGGDLQPLLRAEATYANFAGQSGGTLSKADIVLINSHTLPAGRGERFGTKDAAIVLAPSGQGNVLGADLLTPIKVVELSMPVRLTMLLACETAGGAASRQAQPFAGLVNAFFFSGADTVLATAQAVNSAISEDLAVHFLRLVRDDRLSSAKALQRASAEVRCPDDVSPCAAGEKSVWGHPAYWSQFMLVGSGR